VATPHAPEPVTLVVGMLAAKPRLFELAEAELIARHGPVDLRSPLIDFTFTDYYAGEMGPDLKRRFISFARPVDPGDLAAVKLATNELERRLAAADRSVPRPVNLDPGYICGSKLVLASAKDRAQRIYLGHGIYAEITLEYRGRRFRPVETTYPDYRSPEYIAFFTKVRERHLLGK